MWRAPGEGCERSIDTPNAVDGPQLGNGHLARRDRADWLAGQDIAHLMASELRQNDQKQPKPGPVHTEPEPEGLIFRQRHADCTFRIQSNRQRTEAARARVQQAIRRTSITLKGEPKAGTCGHAAGHDPSRA